MGRGARPSAILVGCLAVVLYASHARAAETADEAGRPTSRHAGSIPVVDQVGAAAFHLAADFYEQFSYPFALAGREPAKFLLGAGGIAALIITDRNTYPHLIDPSFADHDDLVGPAQTLTNLGQAKNALPLVAGFAAVGLMTDSHREKQTSIMLAEALVTSAAWTSMLKFVSGRERPREAEGGEADWAGPGGVFEDGDQHGYGAFPSGHATGIWAAATVLAHQYPSHHVVPLFAYGTASAVSYSRIILGGHWLSDVVVGGLIGYSCARQVIGAHERSTLPSRIMFSYEPSGEEQRISFLVSF
jgi:membrane-associated phospholipid phosphatase